jgi:hypothetical protein
VTPPPQNRLWLYGGATDPYNFEETFDQLRWTKDAKVWENLRLPGEDKKPLDATERATLGATLLYGSDGYLHLVRIFRTATVGPADAALTDMGVDPPRWNPASRNFPWLTPQIDLFLVRSVSFRERWIFWPVYQYMARVPPNPEAQTNYDTMIFNAP